MTDKEGCPRKKKTAKRGKSFAKYGKKNAVRLLVSAKGRFNDEKT